MTKVITKETHPSMRQINFFHWEQLPWIIFGFVVWCVCLSWCIHKIWIPIGEVFWISNRQIGFSIFCFHQITFPATCSLLQQKKGKQKKKHPSFQCLAQQEAFVWAQMFKDIPISKKRQRCLLFSTLANQRAGCFNFSGNQMFCTFASSPVCKNLYCPKSQLSIYPCTTYQMWTISNMMTRLYFFTLRVKSIFTIAVINL